MNINLGGISPIQLDVKDSPRLMPGSTPDIIGMYQDARAKALLEEQIKAQTQQAETQVKKNQSEIINNTNKSNQDRLEAKAKPFLDSMKIFLENKQYDAAMNVYSAALENPEFNEYLPGLQGKTIALSPELEVIHTVDNNGNLIVSGTNPQNGNVIYQKLLGGKVASIVASDKNVQAQLIRDQNERQYKTENRSTDLS